MKATILRFAAVVLLAPLLLIPAAAQDGAKPRRVGILWSGSPMDPFGNRLSKALVDGLRELDWEEGRNVLIEARFAGSDLARLPELAGELVALKVDVIVAGTTQTTEAARRKTATIASTSPPRSRRATWTTRGCATTPPATPRRPSTPTRPATTASRSSRPTRSSPTSSPASSPTTRRGTSAPGSALHAQACALRATGSSIPGDSAPAVAGGDWIRYSRTTRAAGQQGE